MEEIEHGQQQEQTIEENPSKQDKANQEEKINLVLAENQLPVDSQKERNDNAAEISVQKNQSSLAADQKVGEGQKDTTKKPKQVGSKQNLKAKPTIPQPFSLATEKRMSRERRSSVDFAATTGERMTRDRRGSMDFRDSNPKLSKSVSFNHKDQSSPTGKEMSDRRHAKSTGSTNKIYSKPEVKTTELGDKTTVNGLKPKKIQLKGIESKYLQVVDKKQQGDDSEINKILKNSTFKASPLPSFYHRKDSPTPTKPEIRKIPVTHPKSPLLGQRNKSMPNAENNKTEDKSKKPMKTITSSAKETINKLFRSTRKV